MVHLWLMSTACCYEILNLITETIMISVTHKHTIGIFLGFVVLQLMSIDIMDYKY